MSPQMIQFRLGLGACLFAVFLGAVGIPTWVSSPSNVSNIVLAPTFWPYVLCALVGLTGLGLILASRNDDPVVAPDPDLDAEGNPWLRLIALGVTMIVTMFALPRIGMVWTCMVVFLITAITLKTRHPKTALICALAIPLALYAFFAHVAGVAIPQGNYVRLP